MQSDTSIDQEKKLILEHDESSPALKFIGAVAFVAALILVGWFLMSF